MKPLPTQSPIKPYSDPTSESALADQEADAARQARMKAKLAEVQHKYGWDTGRAWNYLCDVVKDPDFQVETEQSEPPAKGSTPYVDPNSAKALEDQTLARNKQLIRQQVESSLSELDAGLRLEHPEMSASERQGLSEKRDPELHRYARAIESGSAWKPAPIYRYVPRKDSGVDAKVRKILNLPSKVEAKTSKDDHEGVVRVEA